MFPRPVYSGGLWSRALLYVIANLQSNVLTPYSVLTLRKVVIYRHGIKTWKWSIQMLKRVWTLKVRLWLSSWVRIGSYGGFYCSTTTMKPWTVYSAKYFNYLSDYQLSSWFISRRSVYLSLYSVDGSKIGECGIGKDFERRSYVLTYYPDICQ